MDVSLAVLADYSSVSKEGKLNIMGIFRTNMGEELSRCTSFCTAYHEIRMWSRGIWDSKRHQDCSIG